ncbi:MAG TPA: alpha-amylase family glycosyl hydrolase [Anaerolineales bacterium]|nr:alpha-amylase family glycosyl hydrolase [Anaerolineales bacterium]HNN13030.1 alpha-amylase family glycosyl hydrolase [Anaerolineales bacterium]HNO30484.1 alpha-amylase family glycosyl hydrolase [Anaerolineales bacterium]
MKPSRLHIFFLLLVAILSGCAAPTPPATATAIPTETPAVSNIPWWNQTVFYEIFVRSFNDSDGDGIGDFNGITAKLDYLQNLGVRGLWLMPIHPSPSYHGYDVTDYYAVNPQYGTMDDFKHMLEEAHKRDIKIIIDLVFNHTSIKHPWFQQALTVGSEYTEWYKWRDSDPGTRGPWGAQAWYKATNGKYYYAINQVGMPDLNYDNPALREETKKIASFWLQDVGIDGFRMDEVRYLSEDKKLADADSNHAYLEEWGTYYRSINPQAFTVGEVWTDNGNVKKYTNTDTEMTSAFNFDLSSAIFKSINESSNSTVRFLLQTTVRDFPQQDNSNFLTNHDMARVMNSFGTDKEQKARVAASILLTAPGIPFIYYGEEIGMAGTKPDELIRTPMQWTDGNGAGFTTAKPWEAVNLDYTTVNVAAQEGQDSLLEHYRTLIQFRNAHPALQFGKTFIGDSSTKKILTYLRSRDEETMLIVINLDDKAISDYTIEFSSGPLSGSYSGASLLDDTVIAPVTANDKGGFDAYTPLAGIPPYSITVIQLTQ